MRKRVLSVALASLALVFGAIHQGSSKNIVSKGISNQTENRTLEPWLQDAIEETIIFFDDFESGSIGWTTHDLTDMGVMWHPDTFNAYSGDSWWCGDPEIGGYFDAWYQMMITPEIDLSSSIPPVTLSFKHFHLMEDNEHAGEYWDGGNVRISTDAGNTFEVIYPSVGEYSTTCMWAWDLFGFNLYPECPDSIPGYSGSSNGWVDAEFDLSPFTGQKIKISYVFASDDYCNTVYPCSGFPEWRGWFIDNVTVIDSQDTLFYDDAGDTEPLQMSFWTRPPSGDWWIQTTDRSYSPTHSWKCDDYPILNNVLESPWIELPQGYLPYLRFHLLAQLPEECCGWCDWWNIWISTDSIHWEVFVERTWQLSTEWEQCVSPLLDFVGERVKFRWEMFADGIQCPSSIYIDDVTVSARRALNDLAVTAIDVDFPNSANLTVPVTALITNFGANDQSQVMASYFATDAYGNVVIPEALFASRPDISSGETVKVTFHWKPNNSNLYFIHVGCFLGTDEILDNNSRSMGPIEVFSEGEGLLGYDGRSADSNCHFLPGSGPAVRFEPRPVMCTYNLNKASFLFENAGTFTLHVFGAGTDTTPGDDLIEPFEVAVESGETNPEWKWVDLSPYAELQNLTTEFWIFAEYHAGTELRLMGGEAHDPPSHSNEKGDVNGDDVINILDVIRVVNIILGIHIAGEDEICRADFNADGNVNILDVVAIVNRILGIDSAKQSEETRRR